MQVCDGVQHAHHKTIIHRDLKPSNVLVAMQDGRAAPKIIDFGVAKATAQSMIEQSLHTQQGQIIGTPAYMSPEQAAGGDDIDTRTDIYSLGIMLYELLVGAPPFDRNVLRAGDFAELQRTIRESEPVRPSTRLRKLADSSVELSQNRRTAPAALKRQLRSRAISTGSP
jgi:non-specific serine/threonine protein kinase/serine/threonine-protein kinase